MCHCVCMCMLRYCYCIFCDEIITLSLNNSNHISIIYIIIVLYVVRAVCLCVVWLLCVALLIIMFASSSISHASHQVKRWRRVSHAYTTSTPHTTTARRSDRFRTHLTVVSHGTDRLQHRTPG